MYVCICVCVCVCVYVCVCMCVCVRLVTGLEKTRDISVLVFCRPMMFIDTKHRAEHFGIENSVIREHYVHPTRFDSDSVRIGSRLKNSVFYPDSGVLSL